MATEAQVAANRRNAEHSTGPRTPEGKRRVSRNAITHGLDCREVVLPGEDRAGFDQYRQAMLADHLPVGAEEQDCLERMVACQWRIQRTWRAEAQIHAQAGRRLGFPADAGTVVLFDQQNEKGFAYLDRKEANLSRIYERSSRRLQSLQDLRRKGVRHVIEEEEATAPMTGERVLPENSATHSVDGISGQNAEQTQSGDGPRQDAAQGANPSNDPGTAKIPEQSRLPDAQRREAA